MNISRAKQVIKDTVSLYLKKDDDGDYHIPVSRQRPIFMVGAPGIGKTAIMEQIASELGIALVSYSMTHHTRQSALGLPYITKKEFGGKEYSVTEYTMSEIIASVYDAIEDMHNYVGEVIEDILERMVFARTLQGVFDDLEKEMDASFAPGGDQDITDDLARFGDRLPARITEFSRGMEAAREAMDRIGYDLWSNVAGEGAGNAISSAGITERTASLLASYVNGIRADVSVQRGLLQEFFAHTVPSLAMYTAEANAHLTNIENSNQAQLERQTEILRELQNQISPGVRRLAGAVATSPSGGNAIRTTK